MKNLNRMIQLFAVTLTFNLIGINALLAQKFDETIELADNSITSNEKNADLVESPQVINSKSATDSNT